MAFNYDKKVQKGHWEIQVDTQAMRGSFEHEHTGTGGGLWFQGGEDENKKPRIELCDYDGVYELPLEICEALKEWNVFVEDVYWPDSVQEKANG